MKTILTSFIIFFGCLPIACESSEDSVDIPYQERLVIDAYLVPQHNSVQFISVRRTLSFNEDYSIEQGTIRNARVFLQYGDTVRDFLYDQNSGYRNDSISIIAGRSYTVTAEWNGKRAWATTLVPSFPAIDTITLTRQDSPDGPKYAVEASITPHPQEAYIASWMIQRHIAVGRDSLIYIPPLETTPMIAENAEDDGRLHFHCNFQTNFPSGDSLSFECTAFDRPYYDYYVSRGDPWFSGVPTYSYFEGAVRWNVKGDGVGLVVGLVPTDRKMGLP